MSRINEEARRMLMARRASLIRLAQGLADAATDAPVREAGDDLADVASAQAAKALLERLSERESKEAREIEAALARLDDGSYGRCERCGVSIGRQRLRALPEARFCLACSTLISVAGGSVA